MQRFAKVLRVFASRWATFASLMSVAQCRVGFALVGREPFASRTSPNLRKHGKHSQARPPKGEAARSLLMLRVSHATLAATAAITDYGVPMIKTKSLAGHIDSMIIVLRDQRVILDSDLAEIYGIRTFRLNEAVKRNRDRFPDDFMFQMTKEEHDALTSQNAISKKGRGGRRTLPYAFTEHGAVMAANISNSDRAVQMSIFVVRAFIKMPARSNYPSIRLDNFVQRAHCLKFAENGTRSRN
jgi:hypothetical protein